MPQASQFGWIVASALAVSAIGVFVWKKKRRSYVKVGKIAKLLFFPVKSMKAIEVKKGKCTKHGFEVNGFLDRSFMVVDGDGVMVSQRQQPTMVMLTPCVRDKTLSITTPSGETLDVEIKDSVSPSDKIISCVLFTDTINVVDCGDEAAKFLQAFLKVPDVRLVQHLPALAKRTFTKNDPFFSKLKKDYIAGFQDLSPFHVLSQASVSDVASRVNDQKITFMNFRPNILVEGCSPFEEDSWRFMKFDSGAELINLVLVTRCLLTTNDPFTATLSQKEPLVTLRKYRIPADPDMLKKTGSLPCLGTACGVVKTGEITVGDEIYADIGPKPNMQQK